MLSLHYLSDDMYQQRLTHAEELRPGRLQAARRRAARRARRVPRPAVQVIRKAFQLHT